jgi:hypothetical protein
MDFCPFGIILRHNLNSGYIFGKDGPGKGKPFEYKRLPFPDTLPKTCIPTGI